MKPTPSDIGLLGTGVGTYDNTPIARIRARSEQRPDLVEQLRSDISNFIGSDLADIAHYLCILHGRYPGVLDHLADRYIGTSHYDLLAHLAQQFTSERALLTNMTVAAGPITSLTGEDSSGTAIEQMRSAIDLLARSDRHGCTLGAAAALFSDWLIWRPALDAMMPRLNLRPPFFEIADEFEKLCAIIAEKDDPREMRAILFGMDQLYHQHDQFWLLLERRQRLRNSMLNSA